MSYYLIVYDVGEERVNKIHKFLKMYLNWIQNSVFEGELTESEAKSVRKGIKKIINKNKDSILVFKVHSKNYLTKEVIGIEKNETENIF